MTVATALPAVRVAVVITESSDPVTWWVGMCTLLVYNAHEDGMRTNIDLDDALLRAGFELTGIKTKRQLVHLALEELVRRRRKKNLAALAGQIRFHDRFDHKALRDLRRAAR